MLNVLNVWSMMSLSKQLHIVQDIFNMVVRDVFISTL